MGDTLLTLSVPALVCAGGLYTAGHCWWRRRHPAPPSPYTRQAMRLAEREAVARAEDVVDAAHAALGPLYGLPGRPARARTAPDCAPGPAARRQPDPAPGAAPRI